MWTRLATALPLALLAVVACRDDLSGPVEGKGGGGAGGPSAGGGTIDIRGAGATFPYPLFSKWAAEYQHLHPAVRVDYQSVGSGGGIRQITARTVDFGASDVPMTDEEMARAPGRIVHLPVTLGAVAVVYHLPGDTGGGLALTPGALAGIFLGEITRWNDPAIAWLSSGARPPDGPITVVHRSDGSGTTAVFTDYLAAASPAWKQRVGAGKSVRFPTGLGAKGNEGVAGQVKTTPGAIGYVELAYARQTGLPVAALRNRAGRLVTPTVDGMTAAAAAVPLPDDLRVSIVDPPGADAYPIASFSYVLVYADMPQPPPRARALAAFLDWAIHEGQAFGPPLDYAPLPAAVVARDAMVLAGLRARGQPLLAPSPSPSRPPSPPPSRSPSPSPSPPDAPTAGAPP